MKKIIKDEYDLNNLSNSLNKNKYKNYKSEIVYILSIYKEINTILQ